jgi:hypothetical protein
MRWRSFQRNVPENMTPGFRDICLLFLTRGAQVLGDNKIIRKTTLCAGTLISVGKLVVIVNLAIHIVRHIVDKVAYSSDTRWQDSQGSAPIGPTSTGTVFPQNRGSSSFYKYILWAHIDAGTLYYLMYGTLSLGLWDNQACHF